MDTVPQVPLVLVQVQVPSTLLVATGTQTQCFPAVPSPPWPGLGPVGLKDLDGRIPSTLLSLYYHCDQLVVEKNASCTDKRPMVPLNVDQGVVHLWVCHTSPHLVPLLRQGLLL